jgi:hypothetical protein
MRRLGRGGTRPKPVRARADTCWENTLTVPVEILAPDRESADVRSDVITASGHDRRWDGGSDPLAAA